MMSFFNSFSVRISLAIIGGILYGLLTYAILFLLNLSPRLAVGAGLFISFLYFGSRLLILFSGFDTPYYSKERKGSPYENTTFYQTAQWVGKFYHYHDTVLFVILVIIAVLFILTLIVDGIENRPWGQTIRDMWDQLMLSLSSRSELLCMNLFNTIWIRPNEEVHCERQDQGIRFGIGSGRCRNSLGEGLQE